MNNVSGVLIDFLITIFAYMLIPIILRMENGTYNKKQANKISILNSVIVCILFIIIKEVFFSGFNRFNFAPAVLYYTINYLILSYGKNKTTDSNETLHEQSNKNEKNIKNVLVIILIAIFIIFILILIYIDIAYIKSLKNDLENAKYEIDNLKSKNSTLESLNDLKTKEIKFIDENIVFIIDGYDKYYYTYNQFERIARDDDSITFRAYNINAAESLGYKAFSGDIRSYIYI